MKFRSPLTPHLLCTSLSTLHCLKASRFGHGRPYGVGLSVNVGLGMPGLYLRWGKPWLISPGSYRGVVVPKALAMALFSAVASPFEILPPRPSRFHPLAPYCPFSWHLNARPPPPALTWLLPSGWHPTATLWLGPYCYSPAGTLLPLLRSVDPSSVTPSCGIALPPWLMSNALDRWNDLDDHARACSRATVSLFSPVDDHLSTPLRPTFLVFEHAVSFVLGSMLKGVGLSTCTFPCIVSLRVWDILS